MRKTSFETSGFNPLASELSQWSAERRAERSERIQKKAFQEGLKKGTGAESIERKKPLFGFIGKDSAEAHNRGLEAAYIAGVDSDNLSRISEIGLKNQGDVAKYDAEIEGMFSGLQKELDPQLAPQLILSARKAADRQRLRIQEQAYNKQQNEIKAGLNKAGATYYDDAARQARNGNLEGSAESLIKYEATLAQQLDSGYINEAQYSELMRDAEREATEHTHFGKIDSMSTAEAVKWLNDNKRVPEGFTADEWDVFRGRAESYIVDKIKIDKANQADALKVNSQALNDLEIRVNTGDYTETLGDLEALYKNRPTDSKYVSLKTKIINKQREALEKADEDAAVLIRLGGDQTVVPEEDAINRVYDRAANQLSVMQKVMFADKNKTVPSSLKREVSMGLMSDDPEVIKNSISIIEGLSQIRGMNDQFSKKDRAFASQVSRLLDFMSPEEAIDKARRLTDPTNKAFFDAQLKRLKDEKTDYIDEAKDVLGWDDVDVLSQPHIARDYQGLVESFAGSGMEIDDAKSHAKKLIQNKWQEWEGQTIAYSPDNFYQINGSSKWVANQARELVLKDTLSDVDEVRLVSDKITASEANSGVPSYLIKFKSDGVWQFYVGESEGRFYPDKNPVLEKLKEENIKEAEAMQKEGWDIKRAEESVDQWIKRTKRVP